MDFNKIYKDLKIEEDFKNLKKLELYSLIRYNIQDTEFDNEFIEELYEFYLYVCREFYNYDYSLDDLVEYLKSRTSVLKIDLRDIDLDECAKEYEEE